MMELAKYIPEDHEIEIYARCREVLNCCQRTQSSQPFGNEKFIFLDDNVDLLG